MGQLIILDISLLKIGYDYRSFLPKELIYHLIAAYRSVLMVAMMALISFGMARL